MLRFLHLALIVLTAISYLAPLVDPERFWPLASLGLLLPWLWLATLLFGLYWLVRRKRAGWLSLATLVLGLDAMARVFALPSPGASADEESWRLATFNCHGFRQHGSFEPLSTAEVVAHLATIGADVLCLQEFPDGQQVDAYTEAIRTRAGLRHHFHDRAGNLAIFSRFPLAEAEVVFFSNRANGYLKADVATPAGTVRVFGAHLQTNAITHLAERVTTEGNLQRRDTWLTIKGMFGRYARAARLRTEQARQIVQDGARSPHPVIVCGDFNDVPTAYSYGILRQGMRDAHLERGWGLGSTYAGHLPGLRIDYILYQPALKLLDYDRVARNFSDHRPVVATFSALY